ncbi:hypothetical protein FNAPI_11297 [Fusarium napiforme]|uniref:Uncharacterized protein n=1 Tax=Fusarium napiforme TaxID=42672 RepID=A0A8H5IJT4_9HYPO|nr:hypothetical protein FNAPI_11297 [Fusarium napiforme]
MSTPETRVANSYTPAIVPALSILEEELQKLQQHGNDSDSNSDESDEGGEAYQDEDEDEKAPLDANVGNEWVGFSFANDEDDDEVDEGKDDSHTNNEEVLQKTCAQLTRRLVTAIHTAWYAVEDVEAFTESHC